MKQRFLAYHDINTGIRQRNLHNIAFKDTNVFLQANPARQIVCPFHSRRCQFNAGYIGTIAVSEIACRPAKASAKIDNTSTFSNTGSFCQRIVGI